MTAQHAAGEADADDRRLLGETVREAGLLALKYFGERVASWEKSPDNPVSEADLAVDRLLRERLTAARPSYAWLSEETEDDLVRLERTHVWIVDPIDGTRAFLRGEPEFAVSAALVADGQPVAAAVFNPAKDEMFEAALGLGAYLNGKPIRTSRCSDPVRASLLSSKRTFRAHDWAQVADRARFHFVNSMAYRMALVAAGRFDATITLTYKSDWDIAAAHLLVEEAGGRVTHLDGGAVTYNNPTVNHRNLIAAGGALHGVLVEGLNRVGPR